MAAFAVLMYTQGNAVATTHVSSHLSTFLLNSGLGKTVQTISFLAWLAYKNRGKTPSSNGGATESPNIGPIVLDSDSDDRDGRKGRTAQAEVLPHLIVAPASVLSNWEREFQTFAPHLNVVKYHGSQLERQELQSELRLHLAGRAQSRRVRGVAPLDVILAPVTYFQKENCDDRDFLRKFNFDYLVVDEARK